MWAAFHFCQLVSFIILFHSRLRGPFYKLEFSLFIICFLSWMQAIEHWSSWFNQLKFSISKSLLQLSVLVASWWPSDITVTPQWLCGDITVTLLWPLCDLLMTSQWDEKSFIKSLWASGWDHTHPDTQSNQDGHYSSWRREFSMIRPALIGAHFLSAFPPQFAGMASLSLRHLASELMASSCLWSHSDVSSGHALASGVGMKVARCPIP